MAISGIVRQQTRSVIAAQNFALKPNISISEVVGVNVAGVQNGQVLQFDSTTGKFEASLVEILDP